MQDPETQIIKQLLWLQNYQRRIEKTIVSLSSAFVKPFTYVKAICYEKLVVYFFHLFSCGAESKIQ